MPLGKRGVFFAAFAVVVGTTTVVAAAIPNSSTGVITACRNNSTGTLRVIDAQARARCSKSETALEWNQRGATGAPGATGAIGSTGPKGDAGTGGGGFGQMVSAFTFRLTAFGCPDGEYRVELARSWGTSVSWAASACQLPVAPGSFGAVQWSFRLVPSLPGGYPSLTSLYTATASTVAQQAPDGTGVDFRCNVAGTSFGPGIPPPTGAVDCRVLGNLLTPAALSYLTSIESPPVVFNMASA